MDSQYQPSQHEKKLYDFWEKKKLLQAPKKGKPYTILMPPPNANASLHAGHGMYTIDDIVIRYRRLRGFSSLWIPGVDHAGFETQFVYEKHLAKQGKSRMDYDRETLYNNIFQFVKDNSGHIYDQFKKLGFLADWDRSMFTLDTQVIARVYETFAKMYREGLIYRDRYMVNYCVYCGTTLAELEVEHLERQDGLHYIRYPLTHNEKKYVVVATVRPETIFVDTHLAVNPRDTKNKQYVGKKIFNPLTHAVMEIIADGYVDPNFGTGILKLTPAHDPHDFDIARKRHLPIIEAIDYKGKIKDNGGKYAGMKVKAARQAVVADLGDKQLIERIDNHYTHSVAVCYKCKRDLEPLIIPNWFIRVDKLKKPVIEAVKKNRVRFYPQKYKKQILAWLKVMHDWPISRQIVWGIRIPAYYCKSEGRNPKSETKKMWFVSVKPPKKCQICGGDDFAQDTDTFDTWFSSGQWPLVTLKDGEYADRYPTDMMGTLSDILKFWISRMIMFSLFVKNEVPFKDVYLWSMVADSRGHKMSKSRGNVINPLGMVEKYGADAFRASLVFGIASAGIVILSEDKIRGMRNFTNKIWNIGRFIYLNPKSEIRNQKQIQNPLRIEGQAKTTILKKLHKEYHVIEKRYHASMEKYEFSQAFGLLYEFLWHRFADYYIEALKDDIRSGMIETIDGLREVYKSLLVLIHPFMPFVTEAVWKIFEGEESSILWSNEPINPKKRSG